MKSQEPTAFDNATLTSMRRALLRRYRLLPYLYTLFYRAHVDGSTVARPLFFESVIGGNYTDNDNTVTCFFRFPQVEFYDVGNVFMWGGGLLIVPVLKKVPFTSGFFSLSILIICDKNAASVTTTFPDADWFDFETVNEIRRWMVFSLFHFFHAG